LRFSIVIIHPAGQSFHSSCPSRTASITPPSPAPSFSVLITSPSYLVVSSLLLLSVLSAHLARSLRT
jgi:hypothetical protein